MVVQPGGPGELFVEWPASARAERYLVQVQVLGVDTDFQTVETAYDTDADLEDLPPGKQVRVRLVAANDAGESAPSEAVTITVPSLSAVA